MLHRLPFEALPQPVADERVDVGLPHRAPRFLGDRSIVMLIGQHPELRGRFHLIEKSIHLFNRRAGVVFTRDDQGWTRDRFHASFMFMSATTRSSSSSVEDCVRYAKSCLYRGDSSVIR